MKADSVSGTFVAYASYLFIAAIFCFPATGWSGVMSVIAAIYFGLVLVNGADTANNRRHSRKGRR
jgi:hypothetical protein